MERFKERVERKLDEILFKLDSMSAENKKSFLLITKKTTSIMTALDELAAAVERDTAVDSSAIALIKGIAEQLKAAAGDEAKVKALAAKLKANADVLAAAVAANTPSAENPPVDTPPVDVPPTDEPPVDVPPTEGTPV